MGWIIVDKEYKPFFSLVHCFSRLCMCLFATSFILPIISSIAAYSLLVTPQTIPELEGDLEVFFFCRENNNSFANPTNIVWQDPQGISYTPGSPSMGGNSRISAEGSRLRIAHIVRNDTGSYRCRRSNNPAEFAEGNLLVHGMFIY